MGLVFFNHFRGLTSLPVTFLPPESAIVPPSHLSSCDLSTEELKEAISSILRAALYRSEHGLEMRNLTLKYENIFVIARIQRMKQTSISENR